MHRGPQGKHRVLHLPGRVAHQEGGQPGAVAAQLRRGGPEDIPRGVDADCWRYSIARYLYLCYRLEFALANPKGDPNSRAQTIGTKMIRRKLRLGPPLIKYHKKVTKR